MALQGDEAMKSEAIKVVIVTYNSEDQIVECLDALPFSSERYLFDIIVVDNESTDKTVQKLDNFYPSVHVIASTNLGYAHGNNLGVQEALKSGQQYKAILILNPDATLPARSIDGLADALFSSQEIGGVSPHIVERAGEKYHKHKTLFGLPMSDKPLTGRNAVISDRLNGCCMLLRPEVFQKIGLIDEQYFLYWEELDYGLRAIAAGFKLLLCCDVFVYHRYGSQERQHRIYYMWRNQFRFAKKNYRPFFRLIFLARRFLTSLKELVIFVKIRRFDLVGAAMAGLAAGLRGETGKSSNRYAAPSNPVRAKY